MLGKMGHIGYVDHRYEKSAYNSLAPRAHTVHMLHSPRLLAVGSRESRNRDKTKGNLSFVSKVIVCVARKQGLVRTNLVCKFSGHVSTVVTAR